MENKDLEKIKPIEQPDKKESGFEHEKKEQKEKEEIDVDKNKEEKLRQEATQKIASKDEDNSKDNNLDNEQTRRMKEIDKILSEGMSNIFLNLPENKQQEFKREGERTVVKINEMMQKAKVKVNKIINLIKHWLKIIPNTNKYYLEQEAKIKTDKLLKLKDRR